MSKKAIIKYRKEMIMEYKEKKIKTGIKLHEIKTEKFKTNLIAV